jgi:serine/threonine-protein kinase RsbW
MPATSGAPDRATSAAHAPAGLLPSQRWRRLFPGEVRQLGVLRRWVASLLPGCPARDDVTMVANELASNAIKHTASGHGGRFAVEITWHGPVVRVAVADSGAPTAPQMIDDLAGEHGRGLLLVQNLTVHTGVVGDDRGRLMWADVRWDTAAAVTPADPYEAAVREGEAALARRFAGVPAWFGRSTLAWWALAGAQGLVSAPTAHDLAELLGRLLDAPDPAPFPAVIHLPRGVGDQAGSRPRRQSAAAGRDAAQRKRPGTASTGMQRPRAHDGARPGRPAQTRRPAPAPGLATVSAASLAGA